MKDFKIGCQLYSVRDMMEKDFVGTLERVKEIGYDYVEFVDFYGKSADEVKEILHTVGLSAVSVHHDPNAFIKAPKENIRYLKTLGIKYATISSISFDHHAGHPGFAQTISTVLAAGKALHDAGLQLLYHNHDFEFLTYQNKFLLDWLYDCTPSELLATQLDTCWIRSAGVDPCEYLLKYSGRSPVIHLKDFYADGFGISPDGRHDTTRNGFMYRPLGLGIQNLPSFIEAAERAGTEIIMVEQDESPDMPTIEAARISREYLKSLGL